MCSPLKTKCDNFPLYHTSLLGVLGPLWRCLGVLGAHCGGFWPPFGVLSWVRGAVRGSFGAFFLGPYTINFGFSTFYFRCFLLAPYLFLKFSFGLNISLCGVTAKLFCAPHGLFAVRCATMAVSNHGGKSAPLTRLPYAAVTEASTETAKSNIA